MLFAAFGKKGSDPPFAALRLNGGFRAFACKNDWTSEHGRAVLTTYNTPGSSGLHSVQGEGLTLTRKVESPMTVSEIAQEKSDGAGTAMRRPARQAQLRKMPSRKSGASIAQIQKALGWQPHTARAAISAQRKAGCEIARSDTDKGSVYRIVDQGGDQ